MKQNQILITAFVVIAVGVSAFFGGMQYQKMQRGQFGQGRLTGQNPAMGNQFRGGQANMGRPVSGEIISSDDKSITVKLADGSSKIVLLNEQSKIMEATSSTKQSLTSGKNVMVFGTTNQDGSVTASNIQLNPQGGMRAMDREETQR